jgi:hypothetical protein
MYSQLVIEIHPFDLRKIRLGYSEMWQIKYYRTLTSTSYRSVLGSGYTESDVGCGKILPANNSFQQLKPKSSTKKSGGGNPVKI